MADWLEFLLFYCKSPIEETRELPRSKEAQVLTLTPGSCLLAMDPRDSLPGPRGPLSASPMVQGLTLIFFKTDFPVLRTFSRLGSGYRGFFFLFN